MAQRKNWPQYSKGTIEIRRSQNKGLKVKDLYKVLHLNFTISLGKACAITWVDNTVRVSPPTFSM
jgi:hypothetical protein